MMVMKRPLPYHSSLLVGVCVVVFFLTVAATSQDEGNAPKICISPTNTYTFKVDIYASERGYYIVEECGEDWISPTIGVEYGTTYTFDQDDITNFWHPLGFSYFPDAHHVGADVLDPRISGTIGGGSIAATTTTSMTSGGSITSASGIAGKAAPEGTCAFNMTCPAPLYYLNGAYLGTYSNLPEEEPQTVNQHETGRDLYEDFFFRDMAKWKGYGTFSVKLRFDDESYPSDLFYYCRIHQFMAGRIKLLKNGKPVQERDEPALYFEIETPGVFDRTCGTYGLDAFQLPHPQCPAKFVCDDEGTMPGFAACIDAMNCHMMIGMTTKVSSRTELALFLHQMIPHHQNAVNMAKAVLKAGFMPCEDLTNQEDPYCVMKALLYGIVSRQNYEIGVMNNVLAAMNLPPKDDCEVLLPQEEESWALPRMAATAAGALFGAAAHMF